MARETSCFEEWLDSVEARTRLLELVPALSLVSDLLADAHGTRVWFAERLGRRWSHIAGQAGDEPSAAGVWRIALDGRIGVICSTWGDLSESERAKLMEFLKGLVASRPKQ